MIYSSLHLVVWNGYVWMWRTISCAMLWNVSWSQGLVIVKNPCKATVTKKLAWLVKYLAVSSHEFSSLFTLFSKSISKTTFYRCFHHLFHSPLFSFLHHKLHFFFILQITSPRFHHHFPLHFFSILPRFFTFLFFLYWFHKPLLFYFHIADFIAISPVASRFLFFSFFIL